jgi:deoxyribose-phosphate aldolase
MSELAIASLIDHTLLKPEATREQIEKLCREAKEYGFFSVCVNPYHVAYAKSLLAGSDVKVCTVVGFPLGANTSEIKALETMQAIREGAEEIDMVINIGALKANAFREVANDIRAVVTAANGKLVKVIIESCLLQKEEIVIACQLSMEAGAHYVKTSTGFSSGGATAEDIALMRKTVGDKLGVKASGGIRDLETLQQMVKAGASRIGTSNGVAMIKG